MVERKSECASRLREVEREEVEGKLGKESWQEIFE
jgi:uncharacterized protein with PIN domain